MRIPSATQLLAILFCYLHFCSHITAVSSLCLDHQRSLLLQFKNTIIVHSYHNTTYAAELPAGLKSSYLGSWNESLDCCQWSGVTCDMGGHVIGLDLSGGEQSYSFLSCHEFSNSSSLFGLGYLQSLNLAFMDFEGAEIPSEFNKLEKLTYLNLANTGFAGQIPIEISHLKRLVTLDISTYSDLKLENPNLRKFVQNLTNIRHLRLDGVRVSAQGQEWTAALSQIPTLQELSMSYCNLSGPLQPSLANLENLSVIILDSNNFSSSVPDSYASFKNLTTLRLSVCGLIGVFPHKIFQVPTLSYIDISYNHDLQGVLPEFSLNGSLHSLFVSSTNFSGPLPNSIGNLRHLSYLELFGSQFSGTLPNSFSSLTELTDIYFSINRFSGPIPSLANCKKLRVVHLFSNNFSGTIPSTYFEGLVNLEYFDLSNNSFTGKIPTSIFMLPSITKVLFSYNQFEGKLNVSTSVTSIITRLDLSNNDLEGPIPVSFFQIHQLEDLDLSFNKFSGNIDLSMIGKPCNLDSLDLSGIDLSTMDGIKTPFSFSFFPHLRYLALG